MSINSFRTDIASLVGVPAAVIYQNIYFWCEKNKANNKNIHDGKIWTYNSNKAFSEQFSYLTDKQIRTALEKLESAGLIISGNFNKSSYDRTKWYTCIELNGQLHLPKKANGSDQNGEPIPDSKTDSKQKENKRGSGEPLFITTEIIEKAFEHFWETWRACKKSVNTPNTSSKATTLDKFKKLFNAAYFAKNTEEQFRKEINSMCDYAKEGHKLDGFNPFINMQTGRFLSNKGWRD